MFQLSEHIKPIHNRVKQRNTGGKVILQTYSFCPVGTQSFRVSKGKARIVTGHRSGGQSLIGGRAHIRDPLKPGERANVVESGRVLAKQAVACWLEALISWEVSARIPHSCKCNGQRIICEAGFTICERQAMCPALQG